MSQADGGGGGGGGAGKLYPMDLAVASQKITIVKSAALGGDKGLQLLAGSKTAQLLSHAGPISLVRPSPQIISQGVATQPQMIVSGAQIVSQGTQINLGQNSQLLNQSQMMGHSGQIQTQIISQGTQLMSQGTHSGNQVSGSSTGGTQVISVGGGNVVVSSGSAIRALPASMRVLPPQQLSHNAPPLLSSVTVTAVASSAPTLMSNKLGPTVMGVSSHVPRGPAAGASLAVPRASRPAAPANTALPLSTLSGTWNTNVRGGIRGAALVYSARATLPRGPQPRQVVPIGGATLTQQSVQSQATSTNVVTATISGGGVISPVSRLTLPRASPAPRVSSLHAQRPLPLVQRNYQPAKVVGVATVGPRSITQTNSSMSITPLNSIPRTSALYYEVSRPAACHPAPQVNFTPSRLTYSSHTTQTSMPAVTMTVVPVNQPEPRLAPPTNLTYSALQRPSILRKREVDGSPSKSIGVSTPSYPPPPDEPPGWQDLRISHDDGNEGGGSTTVSAASSPAPDDEPMSPPRPATPQDISPRKKPRKQMLSSEVRNCEQTDEQPQSPPAPLPPKRRSLLGNNWSCGWRGTALHFTRPSDVRRRDTKEPQVMELANQKNIHNKTQGWKVHHLAAQMDDVIEMESGVVEQLSGMLQVLESPANRIPSGVVPQINELVELVKGNMQRSRIVCEGMMEARSDVLRVFNHRNYVTEILTRQADKRSFRKHRPQS